MKLKTSKRRMILAGIFIVLGFFILMEIWANETDQTLSLSQSTHGSFSIGKLSVEKSLGLWALSPFSWGPTIYTSSIYSQANTLITTANCGDTITDYTSIYSNSQYYINMPSAGCSDWSCHWEGAGCVLGTTQAVCYVYDPSGALVTTIKSAQINIGSYSMQCAYTLPSGCQSGDWHIGYKIIDVSNPSCVYWKNLDTLTVGTPTSTPTPTPIPTPTPTPTPTPKGWTKIIFEFPFGYAILIVVIAAIALCFVI